MKKFESPVLQVIVFENDCITASGGVCSCNDPYCAMVCLSEYVGCKPQCVPNTY